MASHRVDPACTRFCSHARGLKLKIQMQIEISQFQINPPILVSTSGLILRVPAPASLYSRQQAMSIINTQPNRKTQIRSTGTLIKAKSFANFTICGNCNLLRFGMNTAFFIFQVRYGREKDNARQRFNCRTWIILRLGCNKKVLAVKLGSQFMTFSLVLHFLALIKVSFP